MNPKISIVTPSFNQGQFLEETIDSVLTQGYDNLEYIIIDGGSTDHSIDIIKQYSRYLKFWVSEPDTGQSEAIVKGLSHCTGEVFNWLNSDDQLLEGALDKIAEYFSLSKSVQVVSGYEIHFDNGGEWLKSGTRLQDSLERSVAFAAFYQPSTYWRLSTFRRVGLNPSLHYLMDTDIWIRYLLQNGVDHYVKIKEPIARFRLHDHSKSMSQKIGFFEERWRIRSELLFDNIRNSAIEEIIRGISSKQNLEDWKYDSSHVNPNKLKHLLFQQLLIDLTDLEKFKEARSVFYEGLLSGFWNWSFLRTGARAHIQGL